MALHKHNTHDKFEIENAADSLIRAEEVKADASLFKAAQAQVKKKATAAERAANIKRKLADTFSSKKK